MKGVLPWWVRWACRASSVLEIFVLPWLLLQAQYKIFFSSPYTISIHLSPLTSKLGRHACWVAYLLVCVSGRNPLSPHAKTYEFQNDLRTIILSAHLLHIANEKKSKFISASPFFHVVLIALMGPVDVYKRYTFNCPRVFTLSVFGNFNNRIFSKLFRLTNLSYHNLVQLKVVRTFNAFVSL